MQLEYWGDVFEYEIATEKGIILCEQTKQPKQYYEPGWYICSYPGGQFAIRPGDLIVNGKIL